MTLPHVIIQAEEDHVVRVSRAISHAMDRRSSLVVGFPLALSTFGACVECFAMATLASFHQLSSLWAELSAPAQAGLVRMGLDTLASFSKCVDGSWEDFKVLEGEVDGVSGDATTLLKLWRTSRPLASAAARRLASVPDLDVGGRPNAREA